MRGLALGALLALACAAPALAQHADHAAPAEPAADASDDVHAGRTPGQDAPAPPGASSAPAEDDRASPAGQAAGDGPGPAADEGREPPAPPPIPRGPAPPVAADHAADRYFDPAAMAAARRLLREEHGGAVVSQVMANLLEHQARSGRDGYRWNAQVWYGGDINRAVLKTEGEGAFGHDPEHAELQLLYSRATTRYFDLQAGVRQDFRPGGRTYLALGTEGLLPYWFHVEAAVFLSTQGEALARLEGSYDLRLAQRLVLQPRAELNFAAQDSRAMRTGSGLSTAELGLRLRWEIRREFAPYIGVAHDRAFGRTADMVRAGGEPAHGTSFVAGLRAWF